MAHGKICDVHRVYGGHVLGQRAAAPGDVDLYLSDVARDARFCHFCDSRYFASHVYVSSSAPQKGSVGSKLSAMRLMAASGTP